ncbi:MAG: hypothetical protein JNL87_08065 [Burkholderiaceae bacterium]|nr:hypothetical protein [Burkholderiaceae bacterium]
MTQARPLQTPLTQQALALALAAVVTFGVLAGVLGLAAGDPAAQLARERPSAPPAIATVLRTPTA